MTPENPRLQNIHEIAAMRFKALVAEAHQEVTLKLYLDAGIQGLMVGLQPPLPSTH